MPKRKKQRRQASPCARAMEDYERALQALEVGDETAALQSLNRADASLRSAPRDDVQRDLVAEVALARGALLEVDDPAEARRAYERSFASDGNAAAALRSARLAWKGAATPHAADACEPLLERARRAAADDADARGDVAELLGRFLAERGRVGEVGELAELGYDRTFSEKALRGTLRETPGATGPARLYDDALPAKALRALRRALRPSARYWRETGYGSPAVGFFSFTHRLDAMTGSVLDTVLGAIWRASGARDAKFVEWWAHTRRKGDGHALHYDSVPGLTKGSAPRHPLASTVTFLEASVGGPTLVFDQTVGNKVATRAWLAAAKPNRLLVFGGALLHGVLPGNGEGRRTTFMANFWASDPRAGDASDREATRGTNILYPPPDCTWPADFSEPVGRVEIGGAGVNAPAVPLTDVVTRLDGREAGPGDLLTDGTFFDCLETLGCEARVAAGGADDGSETLEAAEWASEDARDGRQNPLIGERTGTCPTQSLEDVYGADALARREQHDRDLPTVTVDSDSSDDEAKMDASWGRNGGTSDQVMARDWTDEDDETPPYKAKRSIREAATRARARRRRRN